MASKREKETDLETTRKIQFHFTKSSKRSRFLYDVFKSLTKCLIHPKNNGFSFKYENHIWIDISVIYACDIFSIIHEPWKKIVYIPYCAD